MANFYLVARGALFSQVPNAPSRPARTSFRPLTLIIHARSAEQRVASHVLALI
jgi:hypothetical protein